MIAEMVGLQFMSEEELQVLSNFGLDIGSLPQPKMEDMFMFGMVAYAIMFAQNEKVLDTMSYPQFKRYLKNAGGIPLTEKETFALQMVSRQAHHDIKGLGNRVYANIQQLANNSEVSAYTSIEADAKLRKKYEDIIDNEARKAVLKREGSKILSSNLKNETKDFSRDFDRISDYVMHTAYQYGRAYEAKKLNGDNNDLRYYKQVYTGACKHCIKAYLTNGIGSQPKLFTYEELASNGTNIGRKEILPVIGATHPFCRCELQTVRTDLYEWDDDKNDFTPIDVNRMPDPYPNLKGLITIKIGDKEIKV